MPATPPRALAMRRAAVNALTRAKDYARACDIDASENTELVESSDFEIRTAAIFEARLNSRMKRVATGAVNVASMNLIAAFINDSSFEVAKGSRRITLRMLRNPSPERGQLVDYLPIATYPSTNTDDAESGARSETIHRAIIDVKELTATVNLSGCARICIRIPRRDSDDHVFVGGDVKITTD